MSSAVGVQYLDLDDILHGVNDTYLGTLTSRDASLHALSSAALSYSSMSSLLRLSLCTIQ